MAGQKLTSCQVLFVDDGPDLTVDVLIAGWPVTLVLARPTLPWASRRLVRRLHTWAGQVSVCRLEIEADESVASIALAVDRDRVATALVGLVSEADQAS